jgi:hypothetical protein
MIAAKNYGLMESFEALDKASTKCFNFINRIELVLP